LKKWIGGCYVKSAIADPVTALEREREREREGERGKKKCRWVCI
jgi:hypothetical protein